MVQNSCDHHLWLVIYPHYLQGFYYTQVVSPRRIFWLPSTVRTEKWQLTGDAKDRVLVQKIKTEVALETPVEGWMVRGVLQTYTITVKYKLLNRYHIYKSTKKETL